MNNSYLGSEPLFGDDPFISGAPPPERDDHYFADFYIDDLNLDRRVAAEETVRQEENLDVYQQDDTSPFSLAINGLSDGFAMDEAYDQFRFDFGNAFTEESVPAVYQSKLRTEAINDEVAKSPIIGSQSSKVDSPSTLLANESQMSESTEPSRPIEKPTKAKGSKSKSAGKTPTKRTSNKPRAPKKPRASTAKKNKESENVARVPKPRQRTLYPVKICRVLPKPSGPPIASSPYIIGPVPAKKPANDLENNPSNLSLLGSSSNAFEASNDLKNLKPSSFIPRDQPSNHQRCSQCQSSFTSQLALEFHEVEKHSNVYAFECLDCDKIYADIREANKHIITDHKKSTVPLLDESIFGNGDSENGKKGNQRRISGMIWSFLSNYLEQSGKAKGTIEHNETVSKESKVLFNQSLADAANQMGESLLEKIELEETATINDLLKQQYIYGPCLRRVLLSSVPSAQVIRRRYYEVTANSAKVPNFLLPEHTSPFHVRLPNLPPIEELVVRHQPEATLPGYQNQMIQKAPIIETRPITIISESKSQLVYVGKTVRQGRFVLASKPGMKRAPVSQNWDRTKMIKVEMPPMLEHYAARDRDPFVSKPGAQ